MSENAQHQDGTWLRERYVDAGMSVEDIASEAGVAVTTIYKWLERHNIERRNRGPTPSDGTYRDADWLHFIYHEKGMGVAEIAELCGVTKSTISRWLNKHDIQTRAQGFERGSPNPMQREEVISKHRICGQSGEDHPFYKGEPDGWRKRQPWIDIRKMAIQRDDEECQLCGLDRESHRDKFGQDFDVHHIVPTSDGGEKYDPYNLVTLCRRCHSDVHVQTHQQADKQDWPSPKSAPYR